VPKIRYAELPVGLHVRAKPDGRDMIILLQPGLTASQRRAALARVRSIGRMGYGPPVSAAGLAMAVSADKLRTTFRNGVAAMRGHPLLLLPAMFLLVCSAILVVPTPFTPATVPQQGWTVADLPGLFVMPWQPATFDRASRPGTAPVPRLTSPLRLPAVSPSPQPSRTHGGRAGHVRPGGPGRHGTSPRR
jgi:hypothetical protein